MAQFLRVALTCFYLLQYSLVEATVSSTIDSKASQQTDTPTANTISQRSSPECASCSSTRSRQLSSQEIQRDKLRFEQDKILSKLHLHKPPNVRLSMSDLPVPLLRRLKTEDEELGKDTVNGDYYFKRTHISNFNDDDEMKRKFSHDDNDEYQPSVKTKVVYIFGQRPRIGDTHTFNCPDSNGRIAGCLEFKVNHELFSRQISSASLWLYVNLENDMSSGNRTLDVTEIQRVHAHHAAYQETWLTNADVINAVNGWLEIDLTDYVSRWHRRSVNGHHRYFRITCAGCTNSAHPPIAFAHGRQPYLEVKLGKIVQRSSGGQNRGRRSSNECSPHLYSNCCLKAFYVNFTEIGWHTWILQPPGYYANYCTGSCRMTATTSYNNIIRNVGNTKEAKGEMIDQELVPCCAPTKMMGLSLLYAFSPGEIMKKTLDNMIVESCGC